MAQHEAAQTCHPGSRRLSRHEYDARVQEGVTLHELQHILWAGFGPDHVPIRRDREHVGANFPEVCIDIRSPAFMWPSTVPPGFNKGTQCPTNEETFDQFVQMIANRNTWLHVHHPKFVTEEGRKYTYFLLSTGPDGEGKESRCSSKLRIWVQAGVHGNEPAGDQAVLALLGKMDNDPAWTFLLLENIDILVFPRYNPDGIFDFNRPCSLGVDLNRDHIKLDVPQSRHIRKLFCEFEPHVALDMHEYSAKARFGSYLHGSDVMFAAGKNLNIHSHIRDISEGLFTEGIGCKLRDACYRWEPYVPTNGWSVSFKEAGSDGKIGRNAIGLTQCIAFLCETRGIGIADQHFHRRTAAGLTFLTSLLDIAKTHWDKVRTTVEDSVAEFVTGNDAIVVRDAPTCLNRSFTMINIHTGELTQLPVQFLSATPTTATLMRARPEAYLVPACMPDIVRRLTDSGLKTEEVLNEKTAIVEILEIVDAVLDSSYYEGIVPMSVKTAAIRTSTNIPRGSYLISTRQRNAALAFIALEPENIDSYVSCNIIRVVAGDQYPIYRLMEPI